MDTALKKYFEKAYEVGKKRHIVIETVFKKKNTIAKENGITILYYLNKKFLKFVGGEINECYTNKKDLLKCIKEIKK